MKNTIQEIKPVSGSNRESLIGELDDKLSALFSQLVPTSGNSNTIEGEMVRAINRIIYRNFNDGDYFWSGYGTQTVGPAMSFLTNSKAIPVEIRRQIIDVENEAVGETDERYEDLIYKIAKIIVQYVESKNGEYTESTEDLFDYESEYQEEEDEEDDYYGYGDEDEEDEDEFYESISEALTKSQEKNKDRILQDLIKTNKRHWIDLYKNKAERYMTGRAINLAKETSNNLEEMAFETKLRETIKTALMKPLNEKEAKPDFLDLDGDGDKKEPMKQAAKDAKLKKGKVDEDLDLGHEDNEPHMLKGDLYRIGKYAMELYQMVDEFEGMGEVDFPAWWQAMITDAASKMVKAKHYLDFETKEPEIDAMVGAIDMSGALDNIGVDELRESEMLNEVEPSTLIFGTIAALLGAAGGGAALMDKMEKIAKAKPDSTTATIYNTLTNLGKQASKSGDKTVKEAKQDTKDKESLRYALATNLAKTGKPQTQPGAKSAKLTPGLEKKREANVKKLKKYIKEALPKGYWSGKTKKGKK